METYIEDRAKKQFLENIPDGSVIEVAREQLGKLTAPLVMRGLEDMRRAVSDGMTVTLKVAAVLDTSTGTLQVQTSGKSEVKMGSEVKTRPCAVDASGQGTLPFGKE